MTIMGTSVSGLSQWDRGAYANANNSDQDDLAIITSATYSSGYRPDDHTNDAATATSLVTLDGLGTLLGEGIIEQNTDFDLFTFEFDGGTAVINVDPAERSPNLDVGAELYDSSMTLVANGDVIDNLSASLVETLAAGAYFLRVAPRATARGATTTTITAASAHTRSRSVPANWRTSIQPARNPRQRPLVGRRSSRKSPSTRTARSRTHPPMTTTERTRSPSRQRHRRRRPLAHADAADSTGQRNGHA
jgi:hypothetical protein